MTQTQEGARKKITYAHLGRSFSRNATRRAAVEFAHRAHVSWGKFTKHRPLLQNKHITVRNRLNYFDAVISATVLFGLHTMPLTQKQLHDLNVRRDCGKDHRQHAHPQLLACKSNARQRDLWEALWHAYEIKFYGLQQRLKGWDLSTVCATSPGLSGSLWPQTMTQRPEAFVSSCPSVLLANPSRASEDDASRQMYSASVYDRHARRPKPATLHAMRGNREPERWSMLVAESATTHKRRSG